MVYSLDWQLSIPNIGNSTCKVTTYFRIMQLFHELDSVGFRWAGRRCFREKRWIRVDKSWIGLDYSSGSFCMRTFAVSSRRRACCRSVNNEGTNDYETQHQEYARQGQQRDTHDDAAARAHRQCGVLRARRQAVYAPLCRAGQPRHRETTTATPTVRRRRGERRHRLSQPAPAQALRATVDRARRLPTHEPVLLHRTTLPATAMTRKTYNYPCN